MPGQGKIRLFCNCFCCGFFCWRSSFCFCGSHCSSFGSGFFFAFLSVCVRVRKDVTEKEVAAAKTKAGRAYFESKGIKGGNLEIAMRGAKDEISALELDGDKIKDTKALDALISGDYKGLIVSESTKGADPVNPPAGGGSVLKTKAEIYAKDEHGRYKLDSTARQRELAKIAQAEQE